jgi:hypothetical protein
VPDGPNQHHHVLFHFIFLHLRESPKLTLLRVSQLIVSVHLCGSCSTHGRQEMHMQGFGGATRGKETIWKTWA